MLLPIHVAAGGLAIVLGAVALLVKKGGTTHRRGGLLRLLLAWMQERGRVAHKELLQRAPNQVRVLRADGINPLLDELVQRGYIRRNRDAWEVRS